MRRHAEWTAVLATARGENMLENHRVTGTGRLRLICPVGSASAITPDGTTQVDVQYQFTGGGVIALETQSR
jgi:hypothetical protein